MSNFLHPEWWPILLGLIAPLLIHLWNRREGRTILVGSIQWIPEQEQRKINSIRFSDFWRFLVRTLLLLCLCLLTLQYLWKQEEETNTISKWVLLDSKIEPTSGWTSFLDSLTKKGNEIRYLQNGFPKEKKIKDSPPNDTWTLLKLLAAENNRPDSVLLIANPYQQGIRPSLPFHVEWQTPPSKKSLPNLAKAWKTEDQEVQLLIVQNIENNLHYYRKNIPLKEDENIFIDEGLPNIKLFQRSPDHWTIQWQKQALTVEEHPIINIFFRNKISKNNLFYLKSAVSAIETFTGIQIEESKEENADYFFTESITDGSSNYFEKERADISILKPLAYKSAEDIRMVQELLPLICESILPKDLSIIPETVIDKELAIPNFIEAERPKLNNQKQASQSFDSTLWILLLLLFLLDRFWIWKD